MAVVWAKQAGNWSDTTLWAFWNETTQQIEDYGQVPQSDDIVYANGYRVRFTSPLIAGELHNDTNTYTTQSGGSFRCNDTVEITADIYIGNENIFTPYSGSVITISMLNGNIYANGAGQLCYVFNYNLTITINGNVTLNGSNDFISFRNSSTYLVINGNVVHNSGSLVDQGVFITINGRFSSHGTIYSSLTVGSLTVNGDCDLYAVNSSLRLSVSNILSIHEIVQTFLSLSINKIYYYGVGYNLGIDCTTLTISNPATFEAKRIYDTPDYPSENNVKQGVIYDHGLKIGSYVPDYPAESVVMQGVEYAFGEMVGTMDVSVQVGCVTPEDVRKDVPLVGMGVVGSLVVPSVDDVREGVVFDNGSVGTLIVQGGGDRLRIADFGYYTNAQSDTYIVDITEADKPKFASAEERILIEMFPTLDLNNIPEMYFDDLFVKYLKYRLIVEYYRTAGVNSTFTPSEPTTEIVNYRNVTCEVWLNSANTYLNAWNKKFGLNKPPQRVRL